MVIGGYEWLKVVMGGHRVVTGSFRWLPAQKVTKNENFLDSKIFVAKTFRIKRVNCINF